MGDRFVASTVWVFSALIPLGSVALVVWLIQPGEDLSELALLAGAFTLAAMLNVPSAGRTRFSGGYLVVAAAPFIAQDGMPVFDTRRLAIGLSAGLAITWVIRAAKGDDQRAVVSSFVKRVMSYLAFLAAFTVLSEAMAEWSETGWHDAVLFLGSAVAGFVMEVVTSAVLRSGVPGVGPRLYIAMDTVRDLNVYISLVASGALFGFAFENEQIGWAALPLALLPYAFAHGSFRRYVDARRTYSQMMRSLARIPEVAGHTDSGHAARTAELAVGVAAELGLRPREVDTVEYAALLHDIGRISLNEPSVLRMGFTDADIAQWGSEIIGETSYLDDVAAVVLRQHEPYRSPGVQADLDVPIAAKIVKVASAYDESTSELGFSPLESMEKLHRGSVYDFDPEVVAMLRRILDRRGAFGRVPA